MRLYELEFGVPKDRPLRRGELVLDHGSGPDVRAVPVEPPDNVRKWELMWVTKGGIDDLATSVFDEVAVSVRREVTE